MPPVPKRDSQVRRRNKDRQQAEKGTLAVEVEQPEPREGLHPQAASWYRSLATSGQAEFYADSDWQVALLCAEAIHLFMETGRATLLAEVTRMRSQLLDTEGDRRRVRLELERVTANEGAGDVSWIDDARRRLDAG